MSSFYISLIQFGSPEFDLNIDLRHDILRKPLNMNFTEQQITEEWDSIHIGAYENNNLLGSLILKPVDEHIVKMRQVAVAQLSQGKGVGAKLVRYSETLSKLKGFSTIELHARCTAVPFYTKLGYSITGNVFQEVGLDHLKMYIKL